MFDINGLRNEIEALIRDNPELAEDEVLRADMLDAETDMYSVLTALFDASAETKTMMAAITDRLHNLSMRRARFSRRFDALRDLMLKVLQSADLNRIELADATLSQRTSPPQIVGHLDPDDLPEDLVKLVREPNRIAIREALLAHRAVPGVVLSNSPPTLMVRVR